ncbi:MAG TPA: AAA family ATPase, partial [Fermentimonas sp.]|nr:AAA family ATPase [Fermentimonas sp.]
MIITFSVKNFRSIRDKVCLDFRATSDKTLSEYYIHEIEKPKLRVVKMAMIYGKNASGKTNILLALSYMRKFVLQREKIEKEELIDVEAFALDREKNTEFEVQFVADGIVYNYTLIFNGIAIEYESLTHYPKGQEASVFERKLINLKEEPLYSYSWRGAELLQGQRKFLEITPHNRSIISGLGDIEYSGPIQKAREWFRETLDPIVEPKTSLLAYNVSRYLTNVKDDYNYRKFFID